MMGPLAVFSVALVVLGVAAPVTLAATDAPHTFMLTYRNFGQVTTTSAFRSGAGYEVRPEGCYAKHSDEAICGFTLRASRALTVTNLANLAHATGADGSVLRTCCLFVQGDNRGYPITTTTNAPAGTAVLTYPLRPAQEVGLMFRVPNYKAASPLSAITFSRGQGDPGLAFPEHGVELP